MYAIEKFTLKTLCSKVGVLWTCGVHFVPLLYAPVEKIMIITANNPVYFDFPHKRWIMLLRSLHYMHCLRGQKGSSGWSM